MNIQQTIDILEAAKKVIGADKRVSFFLDDGSVLGRYFEITEYDPAKSKDFIGGDYNGNLVTLEIVEEKNVTN